MKQAVLLTLLAAVHTSAHIDEFLQSGVPTPYQNHQENFIHHEPKSCKNELKKLCGKCNINKKCWLSCAQKNEAALLKAGCTKPTTHVADSIDQSGPPMVSCSQNLTVDAQYIDITSLLKNESFTVLAFNKDGTKTSCFKGSQPESFILSVDNDIKYVMFLPKSAAWDQEIWRNKNSTWPTKVLLEAPTRVKGLRGGNIYSIAAAELMEVTSEEEPSSCTDELKKLCHHCKYKKKCWLSCAQKYKADLLAHGCKKPTTDDDDDDEASVSSLVSSTGADEVIECGSLSKVSLTVNNKVSSSIKFRTCSKSVDPATGWACNHGTNFIDCGRRVEETEDDIVLYLNDNVETILPILFNEDGSIEQVSNCYWQKPSSGWSAVNNGTAMPLTEQWWKNLQSTCEWSQ